MARTLAVVQFLIVGLGVFTLHLMSRVGDAGNHPGLFVSIATFVEKHGLWLFAVPILWAIIGTIMLRKLDERFVERIGIAVTVALFAFLAIPIIYFLR